MLFAHPHASDDFQLQVRLLLCEKCDAKYESQIQGLKERSEVLSEVVNSKWLKGDVLEELKAQSKVLETKIIASLEVIENPMKEKEREPDFAVM